MNVKGFGFGFGLVGGFGLEVGGWLGLGASGMEWRRRALALFLSCCAVRGALFAEQGAPPRPYATTEAVRGTGTGTTQDAAAAEKIRCRDRCGELVRGGLENPEAPDRTEPAQGQALRSCSACAATGSTCRCCSCYLPDRDARRPTPLSLSPLTMDLHAPFLPLLKCAAGQRARHWTGQEQRARRWASVAVSLLLFLVVGAAAALLSHRPCPLSRTLSIPPYPYLSLPRPLPCPMTR